MQAGVLFLNGLADECFTILLLQIFASGIACLFGAFALRYTAKRIERIDVPYWTAFVTMFFPAVLNILIICFSVISTAHIRQAMGMGGDPHRAADIAFFIMVPVSIYVFARFGSKFLHISFANSCAISLPPNIANAVPLFWL